MFSDEEQALDEVDDAESLHPSESNISCRLRMYSTAHRKVSTLLTLRLLLLPPPLDDRPLSLAVLASQNEVGMCWRKTAKPMLTCLTRLRSRALRRATEAGGAGGNT